MPVDNTDKLQAVAEASESCVTTVRKEDHSVTQDLSQLGKVERVLRLNDKASIAANRVRPFAQTILLRGTF